jgi:ATP-dependent helicase/nuclease subunit B
MMRPLFDIHPIIKEIESGSLILTATSRLAAKVRESWAQYQQGLGNSSWIEPEVFAIEHWINETWLRCCDDGISEIPNGAVISQTAEHLIWEEVIRHESKELVPASYSSLARDSYNIMQRWGIPHEQLKNDAPLFYRWIKKFNLSLRKHNYITEADSAEGLLEAFKAKTLVSLDGIVTLGFDKIPPLYLSLLNAASKNITQEPGLSSHKEQRAAPAQRAQFFDGNQEIRAAAKWARALQIKHPDHRIGIITPISYPSKNTLERILKEELDPESLNLNGSMQSSLFDISADIALNDTPIISSALLLLSLNFNRLPLEDSCRLLNSPFWGNKTNVLSRAIAEKNLRKIALTHISQDQFIRQLEASEKFTIMDDDVSSDSFCCREAANQGNGMAHKNTFSNWLTVFKYQLDTLGWPGTRDLNNIEYRQHQQWQKALELFASLDQIGLTVTLEDALKQLLQATKRYNFQSSIVDAPIQILGLLESNGLQFDHLWIAGMDSASWPNGTNPNSLLPLGVQREFMTPKVLPEEQLELAQNQLNRLKMSSSSIVCSFSETNGTHFCEISPLISKLAEVSHDDLNISGSLSTSLIYANPTIVKLQKIRCEKGPIVNLDSEAIFGGSRIIQDQASCPFNAFAIHRLGAKEVHAPSLGLSIMDRGTIIHECMEAFWQPISTHKELISLSKEGLDEAIKHAITKALAQWKKKRPDIFRPNFISLETERISLLMLKWLNLEMQRAPFSISSLEQSTEVNLAGLPLKLKIDRIDNLESGGKIIIDYKTGKVIKTTSWDGDRPLEPQVPLYAVLANKQPIGVAFGQINVSDQGFIGVTKIPNLLPEVKANEAVWDDILAQWTNSLECIGHEFLQGYAVVIYMNRSNRDFTEYLAPLNRLNETCMELYMEIEVAKKDSDLTAQERPEL